MDYELASVKTYLGNPRGPDTWAPIEFVIDDLMHVVGLVRRESLVRTIRIGADLERIALCGAFYRIAKEAVVLCRPAPREFP